MGHPQMTSAPEGIWQMRTQLLVFASKSQHMYSRENMYCPQTFLEDPRPTPLHRGRFSAANVLLFRMPSYEYFNF